ncbi:Flagellar biosynthetic protein FliP precursor [Sodalis glossinidius str. 'morsitans']|uniref:Flagellar biosynthetic protein FliP n=2 Tax=Sodalis glossinidius TaxID=63612 RepID=Q2NVI1_SODGM|nr:EscR/YscR/HrcR family type III secretion system export apparatus protein [Sodalis glossinidius]AAS66846.1 YsaR [Sodalis glossinidius]BAE73844.1 type III secretion apparatus SpaP [Sodalis glossinidius str. 'morsitans']CRL44291.1 Flagellar biosynthetic protein FliP precursor [Sodalis glossinidius str. 'morsitans']
MLTNDMTLIVLLSFTTLLPFVIAGGTCYIKFSIVLVMVRNALGIQQIPSTLTLNGIALILTAFVMMPVCQNISHYIETHQTNFNNIDSTMQFVDQGLGSYRDYLVRYSDKKLIRFFCETQHRQSGGEQETDLECTEENMSSLSLMMLMPAYALSEVQSAFKIAFFLYVPFVVIDMVVSSILLALGMMMMSPVTISIPIKLILFVAMDGWTLLTKGLILQYADLIKQ